MAFGAGRQMIVGGRGGRAMIVGARGGNSSYADLLEMGGVSRGTPQAYGGRADDGPTVETKQFEDSREFPVGYVSASIAAAGVTGSLDAKPQVLFRGERLAVANSIASSFQVTDIKVGKDSQLAASGNIPGECLSHLAVGVRMELDTAEPGILVSLFATNTSGGAAILLAALYGTVLQ